MITTFLLSLHHCKDFLLTYKINGILTSKKKNVIMSCYGDTGLAMLHSTNCVSQHLLWRWRSRSWYSMLLYVKFIWQWRSRSWYSICSTSSSSGNGGQGHGALYVVHQVVLAMEVKGHGTLQVVICQYSLYVSVREGSRRTSCKRKQGHSGHRTALPKSKNY